MIVIDIRISSVRLVRLSGVLPEPSDTRPPALQSRPVSIYGHLHDGDVGHPTNLVDPRAKSSLYLEIGTTAGVVGRYGPIDREAIGPLGEEGMAQQLLGLDPMAGTMIWDVLQRADRHSRHGARKIAISAIDNALWDVRGRVLGAPVWQLLGGSGRAEIPAYASTLGTHHDHGEIEEVAAQLVDEGFAAQKWFFAHGPGQGQEGLARNVELAARAREGAGPRTALMFDAFMSWDLAHATAWCREAEPFQPAWLEEPFAPAAVASYAQLRGLTRIPLAGGEHLYDRFELLPFLQQGLLAVLQVDPEWCGGVTDLVRMCALAEPFGVPVIPHGHGLHSALHVVASQSPSVCPRMEYLFRHMPERHHFEIDPPAPKGGSFALPTAAGFGIELAEDRIHASMDVVAVG